jgi:hypothetical protein
VRVVYKQLQRLAALHDSRPALKGLLESPVYTDPSFTRHWPRATLAVDRFYGRGCRFYVDSKSLTSFIRHEFARYRDAPSDQTASLLSDAFYALRLLKANNAKRNPDDRLAYSEAVLAVDPAAPANTSAPLPPGWTVEPVTLAPTTISCPTMSTPPSAPSTGSSLPSAADALPTASHDEIMQELRAMRGHMTSMEANMKADVVSLKNSITQDMRAMEATNSTTQDTLRAMEATNSTTQDTLRAMEATIASLRDEVHDTHMLPLLERTWPKGFGVDPTTRPVRSDVDQHQWKEQLLLQYPHCDGHLLTHSPPGPSTQHHSLTRAHRLPSRLACVHRAPLGLRRLHPLHGEPLVATQERGHCRSCGNLQDHSR